MIPITNTGGSAHVTSQQFRDIICAICGKDSYIADLNNKLAAEITSNNTVRIRSGLLIHHGFVAEVEDGTYDEVSYVNGQQGYKRNDLIVARYTKNTSTQIETMEWVVIQGTPTTGTPVDPDYNQGNMQSGDAVDDCPVFRIKHDGLTPTLETILDVVGNIGAVTKTVAGTATKVKTNFNNTDLWLWRIGSVVYYHHSGTFACNKGERKAYTFCTIPEGYRPARTAYINVILAENFNISGNARLRVHPSGLVDINVSQTSGREYCFDGCYMTI